jgi:hypothetical protein
LNVRSTNSNVTGFAEHLAAPAPAAPASESPILIRLASGGLKGLGLRPSFGYLRGVQAVCLTLRARSAFLANQGKAGVVRLGKAPRGQAGRDRLAGGRAPPRPANNRGGPRKRGGEGWRLKTQPRLVGNVGVGSWLFGELAWMRILRALVELTPNLEAIGVAGLSHRCGRGGKARHLAATWAPVQGTPL